MREMKESGIPWIGKIPENWKVEKLKYHFVRHEPRNPGNQRILSVYREYGVIPKDSRDDNHNVTSEDTSKYKYVKKGNLVINKMKAWQGSMGVSAYEGVVSPAYFIYKFTDKLFFPSYIHYLLRNCYRDEFRRISGGIREGQWDLSPIAFENTLILIPTYSEQQAIADYLDAKCADIDALQQDLQAEIETLQAYKKSLITGAVTQGLDPHVEMKDGGVDWIGKIPNKWKIMPFKFIATVKANLVDPDKFQDLPQIASDSIEKDTGKLLVERTVRESGVDSGNHLFFKGQILYSKIRPVLNKLCIAPYDGLCSADMYPIETSQYVDFIKYAMLSPYFVSEVDLVTRDRIKMPKINQEELGNIKVLVPPMKEQVDIANYLDTKFSEIDSIIASKQKQSEILSDYKKSLIYEVVTGKKEVPVHE